MTFLQRHSDKFVVSKRTGCFVWTGALSSSGYARVSHEGRNAYAQSITIEGRLRYYCSIC